MQKLEGASMKIKEVVRHELEHALQVGDAERLRGTPAKDMHTPKYLSNPIEMEAFVSGLYMRAKKERRNFFHLLDDFLSKAKFFMEFDLNEGEKHRLWKSFEQIKNNYINYALKRFPELKSQMR